MPTEIRTVETPDGPRSYRLYLPQVRGFARFLKPATAPQSKGLIMVLHGGGGSGQQMQTDLNLDQQICDANQVVAVYPSGVNQQWNDGRPGVPTTADDLAYLDAVVADALARTGAPARRVFVCGISNGGQMTMRLSCERPALYAAYGVVAVSASTDLVRLFPSQPPAPIIFFQGTADPQVPYTGGPYTNEERGAVIGAIATFDRYAARAACPSAQTVVTNLRPKINDGTKITRHTRPACQAAEVPVVLYTIHGGGHTWPGHPLGGIFYGVLGGKVTYNLDANKEMWSFFNARA